MTDTSALRAFIEARLAEDEAIAHAAAPFGRQPIVLHTFSGGQVDLPLEQHIARHDPARVLREVAAKRAILEAHPLVIYTDEEPGYSQVVNDHVCPGDQTPCTTLRALASVWSDHPDYRPEWSAT